MEQMRAVEFNTEKHELLSVIHESFITVAQEFKLTKENAPTNPAFIPIESLENSVSQGVEFFVFEQNSRIIGCIGIKPSENPNEFYIERLGVLPESRHRGIGRKLLHYAINEIKLKNGNKISLGIINENTILKEWYMANGFKDLGTKRFEHLPFTVCFLGMENIKKV